ncbi:MAG: IS110 family transposase [Anaerolineae bacterium]
MSKRFFGLDVHKKYATICGISQQGEVVVKEDHLPLDRLATWAAGTLTSEDAVALEASTNTWWAYDCLAARAGRVVVVNPIKTRLIAQARISTDELSAEALARLLQSNFICEVWVPDERTRGYRQVISHRIRLAQEGTRLKNRIHAILHRQQLRSPYSNLFSRAGRAWLGKLELPELEKLLLRQNLELLNSSEEALAEVDQLLARLAQEDHRVPILMQIPGISIFSALAILAEIGEIDRFASAKKLCSYAGLVPSLHRSGQKHTTGPITKAGRSRLRWVLVEAAHVAARHDPQLGRFYYRLRAKKGTNVAVVATARKMLVVIWHLLSGDGVYRGRQVQMIARKFLEWGWKVGERDRCGTTKEFVFTRLHQIQINNLTHVQAGRRAHALSGPD